MARPRDDQPRLTNSAGITPVEWLILAAAGLVLIGFRLHAFDLPLETDECNYAYIAARLLEGDRLYADVWDHQPFGIFALFAGIIAMAGDLPGVFRWTATAFSLATLVLLWCVVRRCSGRGPAMLAAAVFAIVSSDPGTAGEGCNREIYMNALILAAWHVALGSRSKTNVKAFGAGLLLAICSTFKTIVAVHWLVMAPWIGFAAKEIAREKESRRKIVTALVSYALGPFLVWAATFAYFAATNRAGDFLDAVFLFNLGYSERPGGVFARFLEFFTPTRHPFIFHSAWPLWLGGAAGLVWLIFRAAAKRDFRTTAIVLLVVGGFLAICLPGRFWPHYYYLLIPALVAAVSIAVGDLACLISDNRCFRARKSAQVCTALTYLAVPAGLLYTEYVHYLSQPPFGITVTRYNSRDFWGRAQGENVRRVTDPEDKVFVFGNEAEIYYYSGRRCASRYTMITGIKSGYPGADLRRAKMLEDLRWDPPRVIMVVFDQDPFDEWVAFLKEHYGQPVGWDFHDRDERKTEAIMFVLARKDAPIRSIDWDWDRCDVGGWLLGEER